MTPPAKPTPRQPRASSQSGDEAILVQFSPEVVRAFSRLEAAVHKSEYFSPEILENLQAYTTGKPMTVHNAINAMTFVTQETMKHVLKTGDAHAEEAFNDLTTALIEDSKSPVRLVKQRISAR
jgi:hypothetical protein